MIGSDIERRRAAVAASKRGMVMLNTEMKVPDARTTAGASWTGLVQLGKTAVIAALLLASCPSGGSAMGTPEQRSACIPDAFRLCSEYIPSADGVIACLKHKRAQLSVACRTVMKQSGAI
jgi:hypothetical protein